MMQFDKFLSRIFFINVTIRECNFAMGTILGKGFAQALVHTSQHLCLQHSCCDLYALVLVQNPFPMAKLDSSVSDIRIANKFSNLAHCAAPPTLQQLPIRDAGKGCRVILVCKQQVGTQTKVFQNICLCFDKEEVWTLT